MSELQSITTTTTSCPNSLPSWDHLHSLAPLGLLNTDMSLVMDHNDPFGSASSAPFFCSSSSSYYPLGSSDLSTGYLEDALVEFGSKRRRLMFCGDDDHQGYVDRGTKSYWNSNCTWGHYENFSCSSQISSYNGVSSDHELGSTSPASRNSEEEGANVNYAQDLISVVDHNHDSSHSNNKSVSSSSDGDKDENELITKRETRVMYPFALVKPGGAEGDLTLKDINRRILMPPTRPVRHPVGNFACRPRLSPDGQGISGKAVVAFARIQTPGRGTITIIRTKG